MEKIEDLKPEYMLIEDAAEYLRTTQKKIALFRKLGLLRSAKWGKCYVYRRAWLDEFAESWAGYDLSNEEKILEAMNEKDWREKHGYNKGRDRNKNISDPEKDPHAFRSGRSYN